MIRIIKGLVFIGFVSLTGGCIDTDADGIVNWNDCDPGRESDDGAISECDCPENPKSPVDCDEQPDDTGEPDTDTDTDSDSDTDSDTDTDTDTEPPDQDVDNDGHVGEQFGGPDCDDDNADVYPGAVETCNGQDDDCDGTADNGVTQTVYYDQDNDGFGLDTDTQVICIGDPIPSHYVADSGDCDDENEDVNPDASEVCDYADNDCDGDTDEFLADSYWQDGDDDGFGSADVEGQYCSEADATEDGYVGNDGDCDDFDPAVNPDADEVCNSIDDDCDSTVDEADATDAATWTIDNDGDGYGANGGTTTVSCEQPAGYAEIAGDCDDGEPLVYTGAPEICDSLDNDCDSAVNNGLDCDLDGSAVPADCDDADELNFPYNVEDCEDGQDNDCDALADTRDEACSDWVDNDLDGQTELEGDCDDADATVYAEAPELEDGLDNDCDLVVDEGTNAYDDDGDGMTENDGDCDDANDVVYLDAPEFCDTLDNDCNTVIDDGSADCDEDHETEASDCDDADPARSHLLNEICDDGIDNDCDLAADTLDDACDAYRDDDLDGQTALEGDCDDDEATVYAGATELFDGLDNDCNGIIDDGTVGYDDDGDGMADDEGDCNDADATVYEGAPELCDDYVDNDCDGTVDEGCDYIDADGDHITPPNDCDDTDPTVNPLADEVCDDEIDNDCDGVADLDDADCADERDNDIDGFTVGGGDCDDADEFVNPGASEASEADCADGADNDCNTFTDEADAGCFTYVDWDFDGFSADAGDCDDEDPELYPGAQEECSDLVDNDCDGLTDLADVCVYEDADHDGYSTLVDCDDADAFVHLNAAETCDDLVDNDCDGKADTADDDCDAYRDDDLDGMTALEGDCDDDDATVYDGAPEIFDSLDNDCNGVIDDGTIGYDDDGDGMTDLDGDCNDGDEFVYAGAPELCDHVDNDCDGAFDEGCPSVDDDGDGMLDSIDCDDTDPTINPMADEVCDDGLDNDCDLAVDTDDPDCALEADTDLDGWTVGAGDCDDTDEFVNPGASEASEADCADGLDNDCNSFVDDEDASCDSYIDWDGDGYSLDAGDCDETDPDVHPGTVEECSDLVDNDCDGLIDLTDDCDYADSDHDGYSTLVDCDDEDLAVHPNAVEICDDLVDNDCVGGDLDCRDVDNDGDGETENAGDCNDADPLVHTGGAEQCFDTVDNDCDDMVDYNDADCSDYVDGDGDGYSGATDCDDADVAINPAAPEICGDAIDQNCSGLDLSCADVDNDLDGMTENQGDCNDADPTVYPGAPEICENLKDENCDLLDVWCADVDNDLDGQTENEGDCNDLDPAIYDGAPEVCGDLVDQDCSGLDLACNDADLDRDGYSVTEGDCADLDASRHPGAAEACNSIDDDCNGQVDDGLDCDADGYSTVLDCDDWDAGLNLDDADGDGFDTCELDCDDNEAAVYPGFIEGYEGACIDGLDNDCDGLTDAEEAACTADADLDGWTYVTGDCDDNDAYFNQDDADADGYSTCDGDCADDNPAILHWETGFRDADADGYGSGSAIVWVCDFMAGYATNDDDCDDANAFVNPAATEADAATCSDTVDNDCDLLVDAADAACVADADADGYRPVDGDCNDADASLNLDDVDGDGWTTCNGDCNDETDLTNPVADEACADNADNDCNGIVDDAVCLGTLNCVDGGPLTVTVNGNIAGGLMWPLAGAPTEVCVTTWGAGSTDCVAFVGNGMDHVLVVNAENFTPWATDDVTDQWFDLRDWEATGDCQVVDDGNGGYVVAYVP